MKIAVLKETVSNENRVATTPDVVKKYVATGHSVTIEKGAGVAAGYTDAAYKAAGASIAATAKAACGGSEIILHVQPLTPKQLSDVPAKATTIGLMDPFNADDLIKAGAKQKVTSFAMELVPRITRAQSMDVLSSQSNLAGYRAVLDAAYSYGRAFPMMMTAAGTVAPAKVFVMGAGVAGLQAIATAKRLGAVVSATDVRAAAKEQVQSLGGSFVMVEDEETKAAETSGGYAKEMSAAYKKKQVELIASTIAKQDVVITTALIPGRPAPVLVSEDMVKTMKPGSVIVDLAAAQGGNCPLSEADKVVKKHGVTIIGYTNLASRIAADASALYAKNLLNFVNLISDENGKLAIDWDDEIVKGAGMTHAGKAVNERFGGAKKKTATAKKKASAKKTVAKKKPANTSKKTSAKRKAVKRTSNNSKKKV